MEFEEVAEPTEQMSLFDIGEKDRNSLCIIKDWRAKRIHTFQELLDKGGH